MIETQKILHSVQEHPILIGTLGVCPLLMKSESALSGLVISFSFLLIHIFSSVSVSSIRKYIPHQSHLIFLLLITSTWVTVMDMLLQVNFYQMKIFIDFYLPIIAMNSMLLMTLQRDALQNPVSVMIKKSFLAPLLMALFCIAVGAIRELLSQGSVFSDIDRILPAMSEFKMMVLPEAIRFSIFNTVAGAFIVLGCCIALLNYLYLHYAIDFNNKIKL
jgi:Na+-translocating ferredoxin:NAD+ oxidoreductase subunit E